MDCAGDEWIFNESFSQTMVSRTSDASTIWDSSLGLEDFIGQLTSPMGDVDIPYPGTGDPLRSGLKNLKGKEGSRSVRLIWRDARSLAPYKANTPFEE